MRRKQIASKKNLIALAMIGVISAFSTTALAGAFQLFEQNAVELGLAGAGGAAIATDASTAFFNSAGMTRLTRPEFVVSGDEVLTNIDFRGTNILNNTNPVLKAPPLNATPYTQSGVVQGGGPSFVPAFHIVTPIPNSNIAVGFSVVAPFGLQTNYPRNAFTRYSATDSSILDIDFSPSIAMQFTKNLSIGGGVDPQYIKGSFDSMTGLPQLNPSPIPPFNALAGVPQNTFDTLSENKGTDWGYGWHMGALWQFNSDTRIGVNYRSSTHATLVGTSTYSGPLALGSSDIFAPDPNAVLVSKGLTARLVLPATITFSGYHQLTQRWAILASLINTQWHVLQRITLKNVAGVSPFGTPSQNIRVTSDLNYKNSWRYAAGTQYQLTQKFLVRTGFALDETPTTLSGRSIRLPDGQRIILGLGGHYQATKDVGIDVGWEHLFTENGKVSITQVTGSQLSTSIGSAKNRADIIGAQLTVRFA